MIQKLRKRFILAAMFALALVLLLILGAAHFIVYRVTVENADRILSVLAENQGEFPQHMFLGGDVHRGSPREKTNDKQRFSPETPFESRFFTVTLDTSGTMIVADTANIAAVNVGTAAVYAKKVLQTGKTAGFIGDYRYLSTEQGDHIRIIFLDCGRNLAAFRMGLLASIGMAAIGLMNVLVLLVFFSGKIVKPIAESYEKQRQFITDAGHEIKTPLTIIGADADLLEMEFGQSEWLEDIRHQSQRLVGLTNDLVFLSRMDEEQPAHTMVEFPLSDVVEETAQSFLALAKQQGKSLSLRITPMLSMEGCSKDIVQLTSILLENALKYSAERSQIQLVLEKDSRTIRLSVANETIDPVEKEKLSHIFDRFYRMESSHNSATGGYGLGLSIAKGIVTAHKGRIKAERIAPNQLTIAAFFPVKASG